MQSFRGTEILMPIVEYSEDYNRRSMTQANTKRGTITSDINNTQRERKKPLRDGERERQTLLTENAKRRIVTRDI